MTKKKKTSNASAILHRRYIRNDARRQASLEAELEKAAIAQQIYMLRTEAGLTQAQLAEKIGTTQSVISRLENTDYDLERLDTLRKLAAALHCKLQVRFVPDDPAVAV